MKIKFPSGKIAHEIFHYMGAEDPKGHLLERPIEVQDLAKKLYAGKVADLSKEEIALLASEVEYALDIKGDHIQTDDKVYGWTPLNHYQMQKFYKKLMNINK